MADNLIRAWWARARRRLAPRPCPYRMAWVLDLPMRSARAGAAKILRAFGVRSGTRVLEVGPGTGYYSFEARRRVGPEGLFICLDIQLPMLLELGRRARRRNEDPLARVQADACALPLRPGALDHVFLVTVLGELPDRGLALAEIRRALGNEGRVSVSEQFPDPDFVTQRTLRRELTAAGFVEESSQGRLVYTSSWSVSTAEDNSQRSPPLTS